MTSQLDRALALLQQYASPTELADMARFGIAGDQVCVSAFLASPQAWAKLTVWARRIQRRRPARSVH